MNANDKSRTDTEPTDPSVSVALQQVEYVVNAYKPASGRGIAPDNIVPEQNTPEVLRDALEEARDGGFETESVSDQLLAAIDEFRIYVSGVLKPYVELDGARYEFDPTVPTFVAELEEKSLDDYNESRLFRKDDQSDPQSEVVEEFIRVLTADGPQIPRSTYRRCVVPDSVTEFLDAYDYLEDQRGVSRIKSFVRDADPPYTITLNELTAEDMWGHPVVEEADLDERLVAFFERVLDSEHRKPSLPSSDRWKYFTEEVPEAYFDTTNKDERPPYYRLDGTVYSIAVGQPNYERVPVSVSIEKADPTSREFSLTVSSVPRKLDNEIEGPFTFTSQGALPSTLWIVHEDERFLLNSKLDGSPDSEALETIHADESLSASYTVPNKLPEGQYVSRGEFGLSWHLPSQTPKEHGLYPFRLLITIDTD